MNGNYLRNVGDPDQVLEIYPTISLDTPNSLSVRRIRDLMGMPPPRSAEFVAALPFGYDDVTAGTETELQAAVKGNRDSVDLPLAIESSNYFANILKRVRLGDTHSDAVSDIERYLSENTSGVWENSWVRFPRNQLNAFADRVLSEDLRADKRNPKSAMRSDAHNFIFFHGGEEWVRVPVSYLIKLALADFAASLGDSSSILVETATSMMDKFFNDNSSPETVSFYISPLFAHTYMGRAIAKETSQRYFLTQLLILYANHKFALKANGQEAMVYLAPNPPLRQKTLNDCVSDSFYRELFMSPCLSGWNDGQSKHAYMNLCHEVLSRSQLNATAKLREAGIMPRKLVFLPTLSNTSLANNGTHLSLGSLKLTRLVSDQGSGFSQIHEKLLGDLVAKIVEHFLPLFVGTYTAAPYRLDFCDFHPEKVLGFLPHELDYTHLRMLWACWKQKARLKVLGRSLTPFGLKSLDSAIRSFFRLRGDYVPDFRLLDYFVCLMSTNRSPALDGSLGNWDRLKNDLLSLGVFDPRLTPYFLYRLRECSLAGFSGFEGRYYSLFKSLEHDLCHAANLQCLVTALAFKLVLQGRCSHGDIPDDPSTESERRQIFFGKAVGIPSFYVHENTRNAFLKNIVQRTAGTGYSRRYSGYIKVSHWGFRKALLQMLAVEGADIIEMLGLQDTVHDLTDRLDDEENRSAAGKLKNAVLNRLGIEHAFQVRADEFNTEAEHYYRTDLMQHHMIEALHFLSEDVALMRRDFNFYSRLGTEMANESAEIQDPMSFVTSQGKALIENGSSFDDIVKFIRLTLLTIRWNGHHARRMLERRSGS
jgi:hypothetical protein